MVELALLATLAGLLFALYANGYLDRIFSDVLTTWFFFIILSIVVVVEAFAFSGREVDVSFWGWLTTGLGMLGTVLGFSMALAGTSSPATAHTSQSVWGTIRSGRSAATASASRS